MGKENSKQVSMLMWVLFAELLLQNVVVSVIASNFEEQKNYYSHDPHRSPPTGSHGSPSHGTPPSHGSGGGGHGGSTPTYPTPSTPSTPSHGNCGTPPTTPSTPSNPPTGGGGGYYPPSTPSNPPTGGGGGNNPPSPDITPPTPAIVSPPTTTPPTPYFPIPTPSTPDVPSPPFTPDPNSPYTCNYWKNHPGLVWGLLGWWGTVGNAFGVTSLPSFGTSMNVQQALANTRADGYGSLYREGTAALLNSMVSNKFPFTTRQVRESFIAALSTNKAAAAQGHLFRLANEGRLKPRN
ncbi:hypothetical protein JCGZ_00157 [Jatropha curcas]|uniref:Protodermal factor 1 n=1 Tax=Jatropha curcas TaxID=180498 RepID=A0A067L619_JATCU|nr:protodermal factor 1 [Jatropha curcas]KDP42653.1 hypothetical protein JCGZ_00157 [Jatropha curcas]